MPRDNTTGEASVDDTAAQAATADTPAAPEAAPTPAAAPRAAARAEKAAAKVLAEVESELSKAEQVVMEWVGDHFSNSPLSRATEALNYMRQHALPDLLAKIREI